MLRTNSTRVLYAFSAILGATFANAAFAASDSIVGDCGDAAMCRQAVNTELSNFNGTDGQRDRLAAQMAVNLADQAKAAGATSKVCLAYAAGIETAAGFVSNRSQSGRMMRVASELCRDPVTTASVDNNNAVPEMGRRASDN